MPCCLWFVEYLTKVTSQDCHWNISAIIDIYNAILFFHGKSLGRWVMDPAICMCLNTKYSLLIKLVYVRIISLCYLFLHVARPLCHFNSSMELIVNSTEMFCLFAAKTSHEVCKVLNAAEWESQLRCHVQQDVTPTHMQMSITNHMDIY